MRKNILLAGNTHLKQTIYLHQRKSYAQSVAVELKIHPKIGLFKPKKNAEKYLKQPLPPTRQKTDVDFAKNVEFFVHFLSTIHFILFPEGTAKAEPKVVQLFLLSILLWLEKGV